MTYKMTIAEALEAIDRGETAEQYKKRIARIRRLANERDDLIDAIEVLSDGRYGDTEKYKDRVEKKQKRLAKVLAMIDELM